MTLAFYDAKVGKASEAAADIKHAEINGASDVESQFMKVQTLFVLGRREEALTLLLTCMDKGLSPLEVELALDLKDLQKNPRYIAHISETYRPVRSAAS